MVYYNGVCTDGKKVTHEVKNALFQGEGDGIVDVKDLRVQLDIIHMLDQFQLFKNGHKHPAQTTKKEQQRRREQPMTEKSRDSKREQKEVNDDRDVMEGLSGSK